MAAASGAAARPAVIASAEKNNAPRGAGSSGMKLTAKNVPKAVATIPRSEYWSGAASSAALSSAAGLV